MNPLATIYRSRSGSNSKNSSSGASSSDTKQPDRGDSDGATMAVADIPTAAERAPERDSKRGEGAEVWKRQFLDKLSNVQSRWAKRFEETLDATVVPAFSEISPFLRENGFTVSTPMRDEGRRSFKFELIENAYLLMIFRCANVGAFELRCESFVPGAEPRLSKQVCRISEINDEWSRQRFQNSLNAFVELLAGKKENPEDVVTV
ncbi:MAG: hypothetical protein U1D55_01880 [Phycisphaerae bacterium]